MTPREQLLRVLSGEAPLDSLPPEQREKARRAFQSLRAAVAAPTFDAARLRESLRSLKPAATGPTVFAQNPATVLGLPAVIAKILAVVILCSVAAAAWLQFRMPPAKPASPRPLVRQIASDRWRIAAATVTTTPDDASLVDEVVLLKHGSAQIVNDGSGIGETEVLRALEGRVAFNVNGALSGAVRVIPERSAVALSVYNEGAGSLRTNLRDSARTVTTHANGDALLLLNADGDASVVRWDDVNTPLPPVTQGEVLLRLRTGRIVHGIVAQQSADGILLHPTDAEGRLLTSKDDTELEILHEENRIIWGDAITQQPESILASEITGWVPRQTPRGREVFARWLSEILPAQLRTKSGEWREFLDAHSTAGALEFVHSGLIPREWLLPDVTYSIKTSNDGPTLFAIPNAADLGPGWYLDAMGQLNSLQPAANPGRDF